MKSAVNIKPLKTPYISKILFVVYKKSCHFFRVAPKSMDPIYLWIFTKAKMSVIHGKFFSKSVRSLVHVKLKAVGPTLEAQGHGNLELWQAC